MIKGHYEYQTGFQILNAFKEKGLDYREVEMVLISNHAAFRRGENAHKTVYSSSNPGRDREDGLSGPIDQFPYPSTQNSETH
ncbi:MAG: hypothetical protein AAFR87_33765 [Bacteroidota bacterium]